MIMKMEKFINPFTIELFGLKKCDKHNLQFFFLVVLKSNIHEN
jgi:hypothetical protein